MARRPAIKPEAKRPSRPALSMMTRPHDGRDADAPEEAGDVSLEQLTGELSLSLGWEIRSLRLSLSMSAKDLAAKAGVSTGMISKLETGQVTPSLATLLAVAKALNVPVARLFVGQEKRADYSLVRAGDGIHVRRGGSRKGFDYRLLGHLLSGEKYIEPYLIEISDEAAPSPGFQHTGIEFMYMLSGRMTFRYSEDLIDLAPGDSVVFDANSVHGHEKLLAGPVRYLSVVFNLRS